MKLYFNSLSFWQSFYCDQNGGHANVTNKIRRRFPKLGFAIENFIR